MKKVCCLVTMALLGCADGKSKNEGSQTAGSKEATQVMAKLRACKVVTEGKLNLAGPVTAEERCAFACAAKAECADMDVIFCDENEHEDNALTRCFERCDGDRVGCDDGSNDDLTESDVCDGWEDCDSGEDETDCPDSSRFVCDDGGKVSTDSECDGSEDCEDGSDETHCTGQFDCGDGQFVRLDLVCDFSDHCDNRADEMQGCAVPICQSAP